jgi:uncharacterized protein YbjT (DUF2867 family)
MNVVIFGASGMIGSGVLLECLADPRVSAVLSIGRSASGRSDPKLTELVHRDFDDFTAVAHHLAGRDACFFCLGVTAAGLSEQEYRRITVDLTLRAAEALLAASPGLTFCYVSGAGTDSSERGRQMWARVKGHVENRLLAMPMVAYMFRPGIVLPVKGVRSKTRWYRLAYGLTAPIHPLLKRIAPHHVMTSVELGRAMIHVAERGHSGRILEARDIIALAGADAQARA